MGLLGCRRRAGARDLRVSVREAECRTCVPCRPHSRACRVRAAAPTLLDEVIMKTARVLSMLVAALASLASLGGLFIPHLYRDNTWIAAAWRGTDLVTLGC